MSKEREYKGIKFRTLVLAKYAALFDMAGISWVYRPEIDNREIGVFEFPLEDTYVGYYPSLAEFVVGKGDLHRDLAAMLKFTKEHKLNILLVDSHHMAFGGILISTDVKEITLEMCSHCRAVRIPLTDRLEQVVHCSGRWTPLSISGDKVYFTHISGELNKMVGLPRIYPFSKEQIDKIDRR